MTAITAKETIVDGVEGAETSINGEKTFVPNIWSMTHKLHDDLVKRITERTGNQVDDLKHEIRELRGLLFQMSMLLGEIHGRAKLRDAP